MGMGLCPTRASRAREPRYQLPIKLHGKLRLAFTTQTPLIAPAILDHFLCKLLNATATPPPPPHLPLGTSGQVNSSIKNKTENDAYTKH